MMSAETCFAAQATQRCGSCVWSVTLIFCLVGFSLSIGWGIRGNFGHEYGAMIPGVLATTLLLVARRALRLVEEPARSPWTTPAMAGFVLLAVTYLNLSKNPEQWVKAKAMPELLVGLSAETWFALAYGALAAAFLIVVVAHLRRPLPLFSVGPLLQGQLLYLIFLWCMVVGNFERAGRLFGDAACDGGGDILQCGSLHRWDSAFAGAHC